MANKSLLERFQEKYIPEPNSGCWLWTAYCTPDGYGTISVRGRVRLAHRVSWILHHAEIPSGLHVLHRCDTPACVNPSHLWVGTHQENIKDRDQKNRGNQVHGEAHGLSKLTVEQAQAIYDDPRSLRQIAHDYPVNDRAVHAIKKKLTWRHIHK